MDDKCIGFDVSKLSFDFAFVGADNKWVTKKLSYDKEGLNGMLKMINPENICVMEATGPYYLKLACFLFNKGIKVSVVNPLVIKRFAQMKLSRTKTDKADAKLICLYGVEQKPELWKPKDESINRILQKSSTINFLTRHRTAFLNKKESLEQDPNYDRTCLKMIKQEIRNITQKIDKIEDEIDVLVRLNYNEINILLRSIPGIGNKTAVMLIALTGGFKNFANYRQLSSYVGLCPRIFESGTSVKGKARICKMGMARMRQLLYMAARSARKHNTACKALFDRLIEKGKPIKVANTAVANKLIRQAFGVINNKQYYIAEMC